MAEDTQQSSEREMVLVVVDDVVAHIRRHAREAYPNECCGALIGSGSVVSEGFGLPNTTEEGPRRRFLVRPSDYRAAEAQAKDSGEELLGFYHSHSGSSGPAVSV